MCLPTGNEKDRRERGKEKKERVRWTERERERERERDKARRGGGAKIKAERLGERRAVGEASHGPGTYFKI